MLKTVSPDNVPSNADVQASTAQSDTILARLEDPVSVEKHDGEIFESVNGQPNVDMTPSKTNGNLHATDESASPNRHDNGEPPAKRQRTKDVTPPPTIRKLKLASPPWKKIEAEGPTTFTENGRRKSGRINILPSEILPTAKKRLTRRSLGSIQSNTPKRGNTSITAKSSTRSASRAVPTRPTLESGSRSTSKKTAQELKSGWRATRQRSSSPLPAQPTRQSTRAQRASRLTDGPDIKANVTPRGIPRHASGDGILRSPRLKLKISRSNVIPLVHPDQVRKRPKLGVSFEDFWERAGDIPVENGGLLGAEDGSPYTEDMAQRDASVVIRIEEEVEPGGILSAERCSLFLPEEEEEPPKQWARQDHLTKAISNFRKLMLAEQQRHRFTAKKLAEACREEWLRRQPKSVEELEIEARDKWIARYRVVIKALSGTWDNIRAEVNRRRMEQWEAEEQRRVKAALNEAVSLSEQRLQARNADIDSELLSDEDELSDDLSDADDEVEDTDSLMRADDNIRHENNDDSDNMSSSDDEADEDDEKAIIDEGLTQEQLREKYADIPDLRPPTSYGKKDVTDQSSVHGEGSHDETSDESVDMDDDLGSSDMDSDDSGEGASSEDESGSEEVAGGLLGLLFGKSELDKIKDETDKQESWGTDLNVENSDHIMEDIQLESLPDHTEYVEDEDEVSLVRHPDSINGEDATYESGGTPFDADPQSEPLLLESTQILDKETCSNAVSGANSPSHSMNIETDSCVEAASAEYQQFDILTVTNDVRMSDPIDKLVPVEAKSPTGTETHDSQPSVTSEPSTLEANDASTREMTMPDSEASTSVSSPQISAHKIEVPFLLRGTLREYQRHGLDWLAGLYANNTNGILADEMGLGKTIQTIALLAHLACHHEVWGPHLVIVPTSVMLNWEMEFKKWCPGFKILAYYGSQEERKRKRQGWNNDDVWNVCITSYQLVLQDQQVFRRRKWHYMILDEAHNIKNFKSQRWQTLLGFNTRARLLLTGTPLQNNLTELWSLLFFLMPAQNGVGGFADLQEFHDWFRKPESQILENGRDQMDDEARAIISKLHKVLRPYLLRRLKADVEKQMPAKYEHVEFCRLSKRQRELYDGFLSRNDTRDTLASGNYLSIINCLMQLRKVCNHPDLFVDRPIMTSFRMRKSIGTDYEATERLVRHSLLARQAMSVVDVGFLNLVPTQHEHLSTVQADRVAQLSSHRVLMDLRESQKCRAQNAISILDPSTVASSISYLESAARWGRFEELQHCVYLNALRRQQRPIYGKNVIDFLNINAHKRPYRSPPSIPSKMMDWFESDSAFIHAITPSINQRAESLKTIIEKFSCVTPAVITRDPGQIILGRNGVEAFTEADLRLSAPVRWAPFLPKEPVLDPWHEARMRLSIQFPDKRLLQYDCGKLQALDRLLRKLQTGGHRALIFTQMTKVLDILEQFLNIHGHKYLRLDGSTKVEQRQILTDRFNHDTRILCFILSTRSGGLGINLTGADTVIFYDQDWNPAMDKQCQDRCHRIGQTRDVHIYRLISEHTIEANILRKASQKQMLDDVVIQEGEFTTDTFNKVSVRDALDDKVDFMSEGVAAADAALDRVLGGSDGNSDQRTVGRVFEQAEDQEDVAAARLAEKEIQADDADFTEKPSVPGSGASTTRQGTPAGKSILDGGIGILDRPESAAVVEALEHNAWGGEMRNIDEYMLSTMTEQLKYTKLELPKDKKKGKKKGKDTRKR